MTEAERATLDRIYRQARYRVTGPTGDFLLIPGAPSSEADALLTAFGQSHWAFLTACNPRSEDIGPERNRQRQQRLETDLSAGGYRCLPGVGQDPEGVWPAEPSVWVPGIDPEAAVALAVRYGQNALLLGRRGGRVRLVWCR